MHKAQFELRQGETAQSHISAVRAAADRLREAPAPRPRYIARTPLRFEPGDYDLFDNVPV